jgi:hypothetical protein
MMLVPELANSLQSLNEGRITVVPLFLEKLDESFNALALFAVENQHWD